MSHDSRSCQSAAGHTSHTVSTSASARGTSTCSSRYVLVFQRVHVVHALEVRDPVDAGDEVERLVADLGVRP